MHATELSALLAFCTAVSFTPGPNTMLSTAMAANNGLRSALRFCLAVPVGWTLLMLACGLGLGALVLSLPALRWGVQLLGVAYMVWLAWKLGSARMMARVDATHLKIGFWGGVSLQFVNIKAWMLALTLTAGWVVNASGQPATNPGERLAIVCLLMVGFAFTSNFSYALLGSVNAKPTISRHTMVGFAFTSNFSYALLGSVLREVLARGNRLLWFNRCMATVLLITALWMLTV